MLDADVPVVQLAIDRTGDVGRHLEIAGRLTSPHDEGVMILGSGNLTHDLRDAMARAQRGDSSPVEWAERFDADVAEAVATHDPCPCAAWFSAERIGEVTRFASTVRTL